MGARAGVRALVNLVHCRALAAPTGLRVAQRQRGAGAATAGGARHTPAWASKRGAPRRPREGGRGVLVFVDLAQRQALAATGL